MTVVERQFEALKTAYPNATLASHPDGSYTVYVPSLKLTDQWSVPATDIWFALPVGYPASRPDCFWTKGDLRLRDGKIPQNTGPNPLPHGPASLLWFSWHVQTWSPLSDTILTYLHVVEARFRDPK